METHPVKDGGVKSGVIQRVEYGRIDHGDMQGLRITFFMDCDEVNEHADIFDFWDPEDISHLVTLIGRSIAPEYLMCDIRKRLRMTLH